MLTLQRLCNTWIFSVKASLSKCLKLLKVAGPAHNKFVICFYFHIFIPKSAFTFSKLTIYTPERRQWLSRPYHFKFFKDCLPQILLGPLLSSIFFLEIYLLHFIIISLVLVLKLKNKRLNNISKEDSTLDITKWHPLYFITKIWENPIFVGHVTARDIKILWKQQ